MAWRSRFLTAASIVGSTHWGNPTELFLDKLRLDEESAFKGRFFAHLKAYYPELETRYQTLMREGTDPYYAELREMYQGNPRVQFVFGEN